MWFLYKRVSHVILEKWSLGRWEEIDEEGLVSLLFSE